MNKTALVTGASKGIGLGLSKLLLENDFEVIGTSRSGKIDKINHPQFHAIQLDLATSKSITNCKEVIQTLGKKIDLFINNVGIGPDLNAQLPDEDSFRETFDINVQGTVFITEALIDMMQEGGMLLNISSKMGSIGYCSLTDSVAYRMSKSALNMYTKILANRYAGVFKVASVHPGWVQTTISTTNVNARLTPEQSARKILNFIEEDFRNGLFWDAESDRELEW